MTELSRRQRQVLLLLADGCGTREAAYRLGISPSTVRQHAERGRVRLGACTTIQAVAILVRSEVSPICTIPSDGDAA